LIKSNACSELSDVKNLLNSSDIDAEGRKWLKVRILLACMTNKPSIIRAMSVISGFYSAPKKPGKTYSPKLNSIAAHRKKLPILHRNASLIVSSQSYLFI